MIFYFRLCLKFSDVGLLDDSPSHGPLVSLCIYGVWSNLKDMVYTINDLRHLHQWIQHACAAVEPYVTQGP